MTVVCILFNIPCDREPFLLSFNSFSQNGLCHSIQSRNCACMNCQNRSSKRKTILFHMVYKYFDEYRVETITRSLIIFVTVYGPGTSCKTKTGKWFHRTNGTIQLNLKCWTTTLLCVRLESGVWFWFYLIKFWKILH